MIRYPTVAESFAEFAYKLDVSLLEREVVEAASLQVMDTLGVALAARHELPGAPFLRLGDRRSSNNGPLAWGSADDCDIESALVINGALTHALDFDNTHTGSLIHVGAAVLPVCLTLGSAIEAPGIEVLSAYIAGVECIARIGSASAGEFHARGFHATSVVGIFGAVIGGMALLRAKPDTIINALGLAGSMAGGLLEYHSSGTANKQLHPGMAASQAYLAIRLAMAGCEAPSTVFEGRFGFFNTYIGKIPENFGLESLNSVWEIQAVTTKPWPACNLIHPALEAVRSLQNDHPFKVDDVDRIRIGIPKEIVPLVVEPEDVKLRPRNAYEAKFSLQYCIARQLMDHRVSLKTFREPIVADGKVFELAKRIVCTEQDWQEYPRLLGSEVVVTLRDGREFRRVIESSLGSPENPMSRNDVLEKFIHNTEELLGSEKAANLAEEVAEFSQVGNVAEMLVRFSQTQSK